VLPPAAIAPDRRDRVCRRHPDLLHCIRAELPDFVAKAFFAPMIKNFPGFAAVY